MFRLERQIWQLQEWRGYLKWVSRPRERLCPWGKDRAHGSPAGGIGRGRGDCRAEREREKPGRPRREWLRRREGCGLLLREQGG